jgi:DNA-binding transcriptional LysR family regulator
MDINLARTFLEIVATGNFLRAAERLHLTQTAVSARVRSLESLLGRTLFVRNRSGASLTPAGEQFLRYAQTLVQVWERARHQVAVPPGRRALVTVGGELSLWDPLLLDWLVWMRDAAPQLALRAEVGLPESLLNQVAQGTLDISVVYAPQQKPGLKIELLIEDKLVLVTTSHRNRAQRDDADYVFVDWGPEFTAQHNIAFPQLSNPGTFVGLGPLGLRYILEAGGFGYFRLNTVQPYLKEGRLRLVKEAAAIAYPAYAVYSEGANVEMLAPALAGLRHVAAALQARGVGATGAVQESKSLASRNTARQKNCSPEAANRRRGNVAKTHQ